VEYLSSKRRTYIQARLPEQVLLDKFSLANVFVEKLACQLLNESSILSMKILLFFSNLHQQIKIAKVELAKENLLV
jgi:hypothetical protein